MSAIDVDVWDRFTEGDWRRLGEPLGQGDAPLAWSLKPPWGRQVYVVGWLDEVPGFWRSRSGVDVGPRIDIAYARGADHLQVAPLPPKAVRHLLSVGLDCVGDLRVKSPLVCKWAPLPNHGVLIRVSLVAPE
jgi:hypothetical protein